MASVVSDDKIVEVFEKKAANISATCASLGITRQTFYNRKKASSELAKRLEEIEEGLIDFAETKLIEHINDSNLTAILFFLKTKGKKRGYVEGQEINANVNGFERLMMELPDPDEK